MAEEEGRGLALAVFRGKANLTLNMPASLYRLGPPTGEGPESTFFQPLLITVSFTFHCTLRDSPDSSRWQKFMEVSQMIFKDLDEDEDDES